MCFCFNSGDMAHSEVSNWCKERAFNLSPSLLLRLRGYTTCFDWMIICLYKASINRGRSFESYDGPD